MLKAGDYVHVFNSMKVIFGTIEGAKNENGFVEYLLRIDQKRCPGIGDFWISEGGVELANKDSQK